MNASSGAIPGQDFLEVYVDIHLVRPSGHEIFDTGPTTLPTSSHFTPRQRLQTLSSEVFPRIGCEDICTLVAERPMFPSRPRQQRPP